MDSTAIIETLVAQARCIRLAFPFLQTMRMRRTRTASDPARRR